MNADFFTRPPKSRYVVPHDRIGVRWILIAHRAITRSFEMMRSDGYALASAGENQITEKLEETLENRVRNRGEIDGFDGLFFGKVTRGSEVVNFDGTKISKKPDLVFQLRREDRIDWDQRQDALFAECKPVDRSRPLAGHYCGIEKDCTGVERFVLGHYAWAMHEALMIGYVRGGFRIVPDLHRALQDAARHVKLGSPGTLEIVGGGAACSGAEPLYLSQHQRRFHWKDGRGASPIDLFHSWHACN